MQIELFQENSLNGRDIRDKEEKFHSSDFHYIVSLSSNIKLI